MGCRINVVNPNTTASMTASIAEAARACAGPGTVIVARTSAFGPASIEGHYDEALAVPGLLRAIEAGEREGCDAHVIACFGDPGLLAAREIAAAPVLGIAEAAMRAACFVATHFSVVTTLERTVVIAEQLLAQYGLERACRRVRAVEIAVLELERPGSPVRERLLEECRLALAQDRVGALVLGCAGMAELAAWLSTELGVPVIDGGGGGGAVRRGAGGHGGADVQARRPGLAAAEGAEFVAGVMASRLLRARPGETEAGMVRAQVQAQVAGEGVESGYDGRLVNEDLAPLRVRSWGAYNIFAFWMSDVHSVGGYVTAGSLFALGLAGWQVLVSLLVGIVIVQFFCNLVAKPSQVTGTPYPVVCRAPFGVLGANVPAVIRGLIAVAWYGIQTYLASGALTVVVLKFRPDLAPFAEAGRHGFAGLSALGWATFLLLWVLQAAVFWQGMEAIRRFIDWAGPAVYVVMIALAAYLVARAGISHVGLTLGTVRYSGWQSVPVMVNAIALVVSYFSGPMLNFGDFARYGRSFAAVKAGNFWGLPVNFLGFSLLTVITTSSTLPVFGRMITDPVETVSRIDSAFAVALGAFTFMTATIGINIVANFVSPAFDFSNVSPRRISWRMGGMIAAVGSVFLTPWNLYRSPEVIHDTLDVLGAFIGPLFGILIADFYLVRRQRIVVDALYTMSRSGAYWYEGGLNRAAVGALVPAAGVAVACAFVPALHGLANFTWFVGMGLGLVIYAGLMRGAVRVSPVMGT